MHRVGFIVPRGFQLMSLAALTAFEIANLPPAGQRYEIHLLSERGGPVRSSSGMTLETEAFGDPAFDTVIVGSITEMDMPPSDATMIAFVQAAAKASRRTASICSGAFVLAEAGLLNGRRATMHWAHAPSFRSRFPAVRTEEDRIFINDGPIWTSAGMTAGIDLVLALIDNDLGPDTAKMVAKLLVMHQRRLGGQKQHSALLDMTPKSDRIELVLAHIRQNLRNPLTIEELAAVASLSPRQFSRTFLAETPASHRQKPSNGFDWRQPGSCWRKDGTRLTSWLRKQVSWTANACVARSSGPSVCRRRCCAGTRDGGRRLLPDFGPLRM
jgi:transcriptional regulator GlxA family with amidase domain